MNKEFSIDMSSEKEARRKKDLIPEGWNIFVVVDVQYTKSKSGNDMFLWVLYSEEHDKQIKIHTTAIKGKRWLLKQALSACGVEPTSDGKYNFDLEDLVDKKIAGKVKHREREFIAKNGEEVKYKEETITVFNKVDDMNIEKDIPPF